MTQSRCVFACLVVLIWALGLVLPGVSGAAPAPTDPWWSTQWSLESPSDSDIDLLSAWNHPGNGPGAGVKVGVVDEQIYTGHPDLVGRIDDALAADMFSGSGCTAPAPTASADHGTHVAGIIAANRDNGIGISGIAPEAQIVPIRAFDNCGHAKIDDILRAFDYAGEQQLPIVVASFSTDPLQQEQSPEYNEEFADLFDRYQDTLFVVAAGNEGNDNSDRPVYPCDTRAPGSRVDPPNLICVGMSDTRDAPHCLSNVRGSVDLFAPGQQIFSTTRPDSGSRNLVSPNTGTSMSAAVVAGVAALANAAEPTWIGEQLKDVLLNSVDEKDEMAGLAFESGRINAAYAVGESRGQLGTGGPGAGRPWQTCDADHDGVPYGSGYTSDLCPDDPGTLKGCPDTDADGVRDLDDNCPRVANPGQADMDGDGVGDACDDDQDGDLRAEAVDACPRVYALTANGCPQPEVTPEPTVDPPTPIPSATPTPAPASVTPVPTPVTPVQLRVTLVVKVSRKVAKVTVKPTRPARFSIKIERRVGKRWQRVTTRSLSAPAVGRVTRFKKLHKGKYRVTATTSGVKQTSKTFKV